MQKFYFRQLVVATIALLCSVTASAYDFTVDGIYYNVTSEDDLTVEVTFKKYRGLAKKPIVKIKWNIKTY